MGLKWAVLSRLSTLKGPRSFMEKALFCPKFEAFLVTNRPIFVVFGTLEGPQRLSSG